MKEFYIMDSQNISLFKPTVSHSAYLLKLPLFVYLLIFSFIFSLFIFLYLTFKEWKKNKEIENALKMLNEGH